MKRLISMAVGLLSTFGMGDPITLKLNKTEGRVGVFVTGNLAEVLFAKALKDEEEFVVGSEGGGPLERNRQNETFNCTVSAKQAYCAITAPLLKSEPTPQQLIVVGKATEILLNTKPKEIPKNAVEYRAEASTLDAAYLEGKIAKLFYEEYLKDVATEGESPEWNRTAGDISCSKTQLTDDLGKSFTEYFCSLDKIYSVEQSVELKDATTLTLEPNKSLVIR